MPGQQFITDENGNQIPYTPSAATGNNAGIYNPEVDSEYGANSGALRQALGFGGQQNTDLLASSRSTQLGEGGGSSIAPDAAMQKMIDAGQIEYGDLQMHDPSQQAGTMGYWVNWDKMPKTAFGQPTGSIDASSISGYDPAQDDIMYDKTMKYKDPNYGWITPSQNVNLHAGKWEEAGYQYAPAIFMAGMGGMAAAAGMGGGMGLAQSGINAVGTASEGGDWRQAAAGLAGAGLGAAGYGPVVSALPGAAYNASQGNWGGVAGTAAGLAAGAAGAPSWSAPIASGAASYLANSLRKPRTPAGPYQGYQTSQPPPGP